MARIIIGIDPDSKAHGVAVYLDGSLVRLQSMPLIDLFEYVKEATKVDGWDIQAHIEDVKARRAAWHGGGVGGAIDVGKCHQAQTEAERVFEHFEIKVVKHKISKLWKSQSSKKQFEKVTGWTKKSNEDTRSAAYFGFLGLSSIKRLEN